MIEEGIMGRRPARGDSQSIVVLRLHAFGDTAITIPIIGGIRRRYPDSRITLVTSSASSSLFEALEWVDQTITTEGSGRGYRRQILGAIGAARALGDVDLLFDLQRSRASRLVRLLLRPPGWVAFDRFAPRTAFQRYLQAAQWIDPDIEPRFDPPVRPDIVDRAERLLRQHGWDGEPLLCLNPAGCWPTKNWPLDRFRMVGEELSKSKGIRTVLIGTETIEERGGWIANRVPNAINLIGKTTAAEAFGMMKHISLIVTEDSGLMHLAAVCGVRTVALFGSTRATWSAPAGDNVTLYSSEDMECGACMSPVCARGDLECLMRVSAQRVVGELLTDPSR